MINKYIAKLIECCFKFTPWNIKDMVFMYGVKQPDNGGWEKYIPNPNSWPLITERKPKRIIRKYYENGTIAEEIEEYE